MAKVDPKNPNQVQEEGHVEVPQEDIQERIERAENDNDSDTSAATENLDPVEKPDPS